MTYVLSNPSNIMIHFLIKHIPKKLCKLFSQISNNSYRCPHLKVLLTKHVYASAKNDIYIHRHQSLIQTQTRTHTTTI